MQLIYAANFAAAASAEPTGSTDAAEWLASRRSLLTSSAAAVAAAMLPAAADAAVTLAPSPATQAAPFGLRPPRLGDLQRQVDRYWTAVGRCCTDLDKYQALMALRDSDVDVFLALAQQHIKEVLPLLYTPTVADACSSWSRLPRRSPCLYVSLEDKGRVQQLMRRWPADDVKIAVITDGERILGLGDIGVNGAGIPVGKSTVYMTAAGITPSRLLPVTLDVGCEVETVRDGAFYSGLPQRRVRGQEFDSLVDETIAALRRRYGKSLLVHFEDFASRNSYRLLAKYRDQGVPVFNDDIESTAAAVVAAVYGAARLPGVPPLAKQHFVFVGAGQANIGSARLLSRALQDEGVSAEEARSRMWLFDSKGLVYRDRPEGGLSPQKLEFARSPEQGQKHAGAEDFAIEGIRPTAIIGAAARRGTFSKSVLQRLVKATQQRAGSRDARPVVLALSNPAESAECTAKEAADFTGGRAVFASGTAFPPVGDRVPAQANNSLVFPGIGLGCIAAGATQVTDSMMAAAARAVAGCVTNQELSRDSILPDVERIRDVALAVAAAVARTAQTDGMASSSALRCLSRSGGSGGGSSDADGGGGGNDKSIRDCIRGLQYDPVAAWQAAAQQSQ